MSVDAMAEWVDGSELLDDDLASVCFDEVYG
jgi:hypothetical protein